MAIISKNIENLKPDKEYIITVRAKNNDINVLSGYTDSVRFRTPTDSTIPEAPTGLVLAASFFNVLFKYTDSTDEDISKYEYELYEQAQIQIVGGLNSIISGEIPHRTGFVQTNVFVVSVDDNSTTTSTSSITSPVKYYGRVRSIDSSANVGSWTNIVASGDTPLIDEEFIGSLTAAKITAGEIGAHTITLSGGSGPGNYSLIQSSTYNPNDATPSGWYIRGDGHLNFGGPQGISYNGSSVVIGSQVNVQAELNANSITVGSNPNFLRIDDDLQSGTKAGMEVGDPTYNYWYTDGTFRVGNSTKYVSWNNSAETLSVTGTINATSGTFNNTITVGTHATTKINIVGTSATTTTAIYSSGTGYGTGTGFWMDASGRFSLGTNLTWSGGTLSINGGGTFTGALSGGTIDIGGSDTTSFHVDSTGKMWSGAALYDDAKFKVSAGGAIDATSGTIAGWTIGVPEVTAGFFIIGQQYKIVSSGNTSFTSIGAANNNVNTVFTATGVGSGTGTAKPNDGVNTLTNGSGASLSILSPQGWAWFSSGIITTSISGYGGPVTTGGATSSITTTVSSGTRGYLRNISYGTNAQKPTSPVLGDIHFTS